MTDFLDCVRPADEGEPIDEDFDRAINAALDASEPVSADSICKLRTWCIRPTHPPDTLCIEKPRRDLGRSDFGPRRAVKVGWR